MQTGIRIALALLLTLSPLPAFGQSGSQPAAPQDESKIIVGTSEVVLDAVVKDKKGRAVKDLTAADFEVYEDGVPQQVNSFRFVGGSETAPPVGNSTSGSNNSAVNGARPLRRSLADSPEKRLGAVALVFDRLSPEGRFQARQAALSYIGGRERADELVGVFFTNLSFNVIQDYTTDANIIRRGIERAAVQNPALYTSTNEEARVIRNALTRELGGAPPLEMPQSNHAATPTVHEPNEPKQMLQARLRSLEEWEDLQRNQQGQATTNGLLVLVNSMRAIEGKKAIIFFSEGIAIPDAVKMTFQSVISAANRANVSIYAVDAAGLRIDSPLTETRKEIQSHGALRIAQVVSGGDDASALTKQLERNEDLLRLNPESGLGQLAAQTGGFLINETNGLDTKIRQVDEDLHSYYVLNYLPTNKNYDGRFRQITVKLKRPGLDLRTRKGYYAIGPDVASPVLSYEAPVLGILASKARPHDSFPLRVGGYSFPSPDNPGRTSVLVEIPTGAVTYAADGERKNYRTDFSIVALVKDDSQRVVKKLSKQYVLNGPLGEVDAAKRGEILFYRETELSPGRYTIEAACYDALTRKSSVSSKAVEVPEAGEKELQLSDLALLKRVEKVSSSTTGPQTESNPFQYGEVQVYPNLGEPFDQAKDKQLAFFLTAYTTLGTKSAPRLIIELMQNERSLGQAKLDLPPPDTSGRIQYASALPIEKLKAGEYTLKATVDDGARRVTRSAPFILR